ncbi:hypothetical protein KR018_003209, partial [Drosophila ironensis]
INLFSLYISVISQTVISLENATFPVQPAVHPVPELPPLTKDTTTSTTAKPITSSSTSTTSTTSTTTTSTTTTTTTAPPTTTSTPAPSPAPTHAPPAPPAPSVGTWNGTCILLKMAAQMNFTYETKEGKQAHGLYNIPSNATVSEKLCHSPVSQSIGLTWGTNDSVDSLVMQFDNINKTVSLASILITFSVPAKDFPDAKVNQSIQLYHRSKDFLVPQNMSYHCTREQKFNMTAGINSNTEIGWLTVSQVKAEAFLSDKATDFSTVHDCDSSETSDVVPIAVGIALAGLILVVLISYLCARRRSTSRGYMSF